MSRKPLIVALVAAVALSACGGSSTTTSSATGTSTTGITSTTTTSTTRSTTTDSAQSHATTTSPRTTTTPPPPASKPAPAGLAGREWTVIPTKRRIVALTFDAGANSDGVASILATLAREHVPATMFLTGEFVSHFKAAARQIAGASLRIGDHSISHPYFTKLSDAQIREQVRGAAVEIAATTGADPWPWFRFPYGDRNAHAISVVNSLGFVPVGWTVDTLGWEGTSRGITAESIVSRVLAHLQPGEIVLMHCGSNPTDHSKLDADALPTVIRELRGRGYSFVTLDALAGES